MATDVVARLKLRAESFSREVRKAFDEVPAQADRAGRDAGNRMGAGIGAGLKAGIAGLAIGTAVREIAQVVGRAVDFGVELGNNAKALNTNVEELQAYREAANGVGIANKAMDDGLQQLFQSITKASAGGKEQTAAFRSLGVSLVDTNGFARTTTDVMGEVIDKLDAIPDPLRQAQLGSAIFGDRWRDMAPLLDAGSEGLQKLTGSILSTGTALSTKEIQELGRINAEFERMQRTLERDISRAVAANADAIVTLGNALGWVAGKAVSAAASVAQFVQGFANLSESRGFLGALNATPGEAVRAATPAGHLMDMQRELTDLRTRLRNIPTSGGDRLFLDSRRKSLQARISELDSTYRRTLSSGIRSGALFASPSAGSAPPGLASITPPKVSGSGKPRGGMSKEEREREQAAKRLRAEWDRLGQSLDDQVVKQREAAEIEAIRAVMGDRAAERQKALLDVNRKNADLIKESGVTKTPEEVVKQFNVSIAEAQHRLDQLASVRRTAVLDVDIEFDEKEAQEEAKKNAAIFQRELKAQADLRKADEDRRAAEARRHFEDLSSFYFDLFDGNTRNIWDNFKRLGLNALAELAADQTMKLLSGKDRVSIGSSLRTLFAAQEGDAIGGMTKGALASSIADAIGFQQSRTGALAGGFLGSTGLVQKLLGSTLGPFGGAIGGLLGGTIGGLFKKSKWGTAVLSGGADPSIAGNKATVRSSAGGAAGSVQDTLAMIANQLGGDLGSYNVSIGQYKDKWRVSTSGYTGKLKLGKNGVVDFGKEGQEEAIRYAIRDALADGAIRGISDAAQRILRSGQDIEVALEKAVSIESIPKLLKARLDPLGAALDEIDGKFEKLAATLREGGGSAEQIAQARQLWQLERADAIAEIGQASAVLRDYLKTLRVGPDSPLSLRTQAADAEAAMAPYLAQIRAAEDAKAQYDQLTASKAAGGAVRDADIKAAKEAAAAAAAAIDQSGFRDSAALFLDVSRQLGGSTRAFFDQFDRIQGLTNSAIALVENAVPLRADEKDPFAALTAKSTEATAAILGDHTALLNGILNGIYSLGGTPGGSGFIGSDRGFIRAL